MTGRMDLSRLSCASLTEVPFAVRYWYRNGCFGWEDATGYCIFWPQQNYIPSKSGECHWWLVSFLFISSEIVVLIMWTIALDWHSSQPLFARPVPWTWWGLSAVFSPECWNLTCPSSPNLGSTRCRWPPLPSDPFPGAPVMPGYTADSWQLTAS